MRAPCFAERLLAQSHLHTRRVPKKIGQDIEAQAAPCMQTLYLQGGDSVPSWQADQLAQKALILSKKVLQSAEGTLR